MPNYPEKWGQMTPEEKRQHRLNNTLDTSRLKFPTKEAETAYLVKQKRIVDVYNVKEPDRVPCNVSFGSVALRESGVTPYMAMYEPEKAIAACAKFNAKYGAEFETAAMTWSMPGQVLDLLDYKQYAWPGHGLAKDGLSTWQFVEGEYMTADEYDDLIRDPSDFWIRTWFPRAFGVFQPMKMFQPFTNITENVHLMQFMPFATDEGQAMLQKLMEIGKAYKKNMEIQAKAMGGMGGMGTGARPGGITFAKAPFDTLGDTLRGTTNIMKDMFRRPAKLLKALDVVADLTINTILKSPGIENATVITYPLHKGADGWMSQKQFDTFYWPSLKKVMDAFINEGIIQNLFAEGSFNTRLEYVADFPKGSVTWLFDRTDMFKAKDVLGKNFCIMGNVPSSMLVTGERNDVKEYCKKLIEYCGKGGGYVLTSGSTPENPKMDNLRAMLEAAKEYGVYKKK